LRIALFDHNYLFAFNYFRFHLHLIRGLEVAFVLGLGAHALHGIHHVGLLRQERIA